MVPLSYQDFSLLLPKGPLASTQSNHLTFGGSIPKQSFHSGRRMPPADLRMHQRPGPGIILRPHGEVVFRNTARGLKPPHHNHHCIQSQSDCKKWPPHRIRATAAPSHHPNQCTAPQSQTIHAKGFTILHSVSPKQDSSHPTDVGCKQYTTGSRHPSIHDIMPSPQPVIPLQISNTYQYLRPRSSH